MYLSCSQLRQRTTKIPQLGYKELPNGTVRFRLEKLLLYFQRNKMPSQDFLATWTFCDLLLPYLGGKNWKCDPFGIVITKLLQNITKQDLHSKNSNFPSFRFWEKDYQNDLLRQSYGKLAYCRLPKTCFTSRIFLIGNYIMSPVEICMLSARCPKKTIVVSCFTLNCFRLVFSTKGSRKSRCFLKLSFSEIYVLLTESNSK